MFYILTGIIIAIYIIDYILGGPKEEISEDQQKLNSFKNLYKNNKDLYVYLPLFSRNIYFFIKQVESYGSKPEYDDLEILNAQILFKDYLNLNTYLIKRSYLLRKVNLPYEIKELEDKMANKIKEEKLYKENQKRILSQRKELNLAY